MQGQPLQEVREVVEVRPDPDDAEMGRGNMGRSDDRRPPVEGCRAHGDPGAAERGEGLPSSALGEAKITNHYRPGKGVDGNPADGELSAGRRLHPLHRLAFDDAGEHERDETRQKKHDTCGNERRFLPSLHSSPFHQFIAYTPCKEPASPDRIPVGLFIRSVNRILS